MILLPKTMLPPAGRRSRDADLRDANREGLDLRDAMCDADTRWPAGFDYRSRGVIDLSEPEPSAT
jgi:hypothetical protein